MNRQPKMSPEVAQKWSPQTRPQSNTQSGHNTLPFMTTLLLSTLSLLLILINL